MKIELIRHAELVSASETIDRHPETLNRHPELVSGSVSGALYISGTYICDTEENPLTALPAGKYQIIRHYCKQYKRMMPVVQTLRHPELVSGSDQLTARCEQCEQLELVSNTTTMPCICPMLKPGNGIHHRTDGSIILGTRIIPGCLSHPLQAFNPLAERIRKAIARGHKVHLVILNEVKDLENTQRHPELVSGSESEMNSCNP